MMGLTRRALPQNGRYAMTTAKSASIRMTRKMPVTTAEVAARPPLLRALDRQALVAAHGAHQQPEEDGFDHADHEVPDTQDLLRLGEVLRDGQIELQDPDCEPAGDPATPESSARQGIAITTAMTRGTTRCESGSSPIVESASTSSLTFIEPSSAAKPLPERPAMSIAVMIGPSSRTIAIATPSAT